MVPRYRRPSHKRRILVVVAERNGRCWWVARHSCWPAGWAFLCRSGNLSASGGRIKVQTKCKHAPRHSTTWANRRNAESSAIEPNRRTRRHSTVPQKWAHNPKVAGSNPAPATRKNPGNPGFFRGVGSLPSALRASIGHQFVDGPAFARRGFAARMASAVAPRTFACHEALCSSSAAQLVEKSENDQR